MCREVSRILGLFYDLLGHEGYGVTELRAFSGTRRLVAYTASRRGFTRLCLKQDGQKNIYAGINPRPLDLFDCAPECWVRCASWKNLGSVNTEALPMGLCARDVDIEYVTAIFYDIDPTSRDGRPASEEELQRTVRAGRVLLEEPAFAKGGVLATSGNGCYVILPLRAIQVDRENEPKARIFHDRHRKSGRGYQSDRVSNPSRIMRVIGTLNLKGDPEEDRPHRRATFITAWSGERSEEASAEIEYIECASVPERGSDLGLVLPLQGSVEAMRRCEFLRFCIERPEKVTNEQWFAMMVNLIPLQNGRDLVHEVSALDSGRYDRTDTDARVRRYQKYGYLPMRCDRLGFTCPKRAECRAGCPLYLAVRKEA